MSNKRTMLCGKEVLAIGEETSLADKREKRSMCLLCEMGTTSDCLCEYREKYLSEGEIR